MSIDDRIAAFPEISPPKSDGIRSSAPPYAWLSVIPLQPSTLAASRRTSSPSDVICKCGRYEERTVLHIIFDCPLFQRARDDAHTVSIPQSTTSSAPPKGPSSCSNSWNVPPPRTNPHAAPGCLASLVSIPIQTDDIRTIVLFDGRPLPWPHRPGATSTSYNPACLRPYQGYLRLFYHPTSLRYPPPPLERGH